MKTLSGLECRLLLKCSKMSTRQDKEVDFKDFIDKCRIILVYVEDGGTHDECYNVLL